MSKSGFAFYISKWEKYQSEICEVRDRVFVEEVGLPAQHTRWEQDGESYHVLAYDHDGKLVGTGSIKPTGEIGHIAVLRAWRGRTVGKAILNYLLHVAERLYLPAVWVDAMNQHIEFYQRKGFSVTDQGTLKDGHEFTRLVKTFEVKNTLH